MTAVAVGAVLALAASCAGGSQTSADGGTPRDGGTLNLAIGREPNCLDPHQSPSAAARVVSRPIVDSLVYQDRKGAIKPWLASRWTIAEDRKAYTFTLRDDVRFTDGAPFDAAAVVANLEHIVAPKTKSLLAASLIASYESSRAIDAHTVEVRLSEPSSSLLDVLATPNLGMESPATLTRSNDALCATIVGTGPFASPGGYRQQQGIEYVRNRDYAWAPAGLGHTGPARLDGIRIRVASDNSARYGALSSGQVDAITTLSPVNLRELRTADGFHLFSVPFPGIPYSYFPNTASGVLADVGVRKAFRAGIDWAQIVKNVYFGVYPSARGVLTSTTLGYDRSQESAYAYNPTEAARLLDQAGWTGRDAKGYRTKNGARLTLRHLWSDPSIEDLAVQVQAAAKELGIEIVEENIDEGTYVDRILSADYELADTNFASPGPEVLKVLYGSANVPSPTRGLANNISRYASGALDKLFLQAAASESVTDRLRIYGQAQRQLTADAAVFPIYSPLSTVAARSGVRDVTFDIDGSPSFYDTWLTS
ncbi:ABC transporter substrate-binding protein [Frankia sp. QA3]|uniref:ABC transporter substrate-binding protein n=1 Tax=Frankia sp. QA3 TaxID=710111 RepID=UPI000269C18C|nr:ABC transporter substrate-binding protein [Frankia sp. QA3]EIV92562.1 ABC-type dipeptide transport system, periplasmic component [Frankia sp. QA3]